MTTPGVKGCTCHRHTDKDYIQELGDNRRIQIVRRRMSDMEI